MLDFDLLVLAPAHRTFGERNRGKPVPIYTPPDGGAMIEIDGVFRLDPLDVLGGAEMPGISTRKPMLDIRAAAVPPEIEIVQGGTFEVRGVSYAIADVRPDGEGLITLQLEEAPVS